MTVRAQQVLDAAKLWSMLRILSVHSEDCDRR